MIDRLEELLERLAQEDDREREEDVMELAGAPALPAPGDGELDGAARAGREAGARPGEAAEEGRPAQAAGWAAETAPAMGLEGRGGAPAGLERRGTRADEIPPPEAEPAERGLAGLYRQAVRAGRTQELAWPAGREGRTLRAEEPGGSGGLTVEELDRAVRRDSRRYDGGMSIF